MSLAKFEGVFVSSHVPGDFVTRVEERVPVVGLDEVLAAGGVGQHAVDVEHDGRAGFEGPGPPSPVGRGR